MKLKPPSWDDRLNVLVTAPFDFSRYVDRNIPLTNSGGEEATVGGRSRHRKPRRPRLVRALPEVHGRYGRQILRHLSPKKLARSVGQFLTR